MPPQAGPLEGSEYFPEEEVVMGTPRRKSGVLAGEVEPYREWLLAQGYSSASVIRTPDMSGAGVGLGVS